MAINRDTLSNHSVVIDEAIEGVEPVDPASYRVVSDRNTELSLTTRVKQFDDQHFFSDFEPSPQLVRFVPGHLEGLRSSLALEGEQSLGPDHDVSKLPVLKMLALFIDDSADVLLGSVGNLELDFGNIRVHQVTTPFLHLHGDDFSEPVVLERKVVEPSLLVNRKVVVVGHAVGDLDLAGSVDSRIFVDLDLGHLVDHHRFCGNFE